jgi:hypothetical protein
MYEFSQNLGFLVTDIYRRFPGSLQALSLARGQAPPRKIRKNPPILLTPERFLKPTTSGQKPKQN